ncbi:cilia- and flagella-associated protein 73 [Fukomys damarensis]|uniref:cilia- and flagella-associated protein 73 n=1 Tax=Fukomys damarensis TaxID=885580 RepID=UPI001455D80E|nr:cilia- and flagella-associated protein 73 [Fukomys damarensis]
MAVPWEEYFRLAWQEKLRKTQEQSLDRFPPVLRLLEKRQELADVDRGLQAQKEEFHTTMSALQHRWAQLEQKQQELKGSLVRFDKFLQVLEMAGRDPRRRQPGSGSRVGGGSQARPEAEIQATWAPVQEVGLQGPGAPVSCAGSACALSPRAPVRAWRTGERQGNRVRSRAGAVPQESKWIQIQNTAAEKTLLLGRTRMSALSLSQLARQHQRQPCTLAVEDTEGQLEQVKVFILDLSATLAGLDGRCEEPGHMAVGLTESTQQAQNKCRPWRLGRGAARPTPHLS